MENKKSKKDIAFDKECAKYRHEIRKRGDAMFLRVISTGSKAGNCYALVSDSGQILLLDFGCDKKKIIRGIDYKISDVVSAVLTHGHG